MSSPVGWYADPLGRHEHRYWDGASWTEHVADGGRSGQDPIDAAPPGSSGGPAASTITDTSPAPAHAAVEPAAAQTQGPADQPLPQQPPATWQPGGPPAQSPPTNGLAVASMIIGIASLLVSWIPFIGLLGVVGGALALLLGLFGRGRAKKVANGGALALTGIITGLLAVLAGIATTVLPVLFFQGMVGDLEAVDRCIEQTGDEQACIDEHAPGWVRLLEGID